MSVKSSDVTDWWGSLLTSFGFFGCSRNAVIVLCLRQVCDRNLRNASGFNKLTVFSQQFRLLTEPKKFIPLAVSRNAIRSPLQIIASSVKLFFAVVMLYFIVLFIVYCNVIMPINHSTSWNRWRMCNAARVPRTFRCVLSAYAGRNDAHLCTLWCRLQVGCWIGQK